MEKCIGVITGKYYTERHTQKFQVTTPSIYLALATRQTPFYTFQREEHIYPSQQPGRLFPPLSPHSTYRGPERANVSLSEDMRSWDPKPGIQA